MKQAWTIFLLSLFFQIEQLAAGENADMQLWLIEQDFVKFGKREIFELQKRGWIAELQRERTSFSIFGFEDKDSNQFFFLTPLKQMSSFQDYLKFHQSSLGSFSIPQNRNQSAIQDTTLNFFILSVHEYLSSCSTGFSPSENGYVYYSIYSVYPGNEETFEKYWKKKVREESSAKQWGVWRVLCGGDLPKYVVALFAKTEEDLERGLKGGFFTLPYAKEILRRQQEGKALLRKDLSTEL